MYADLKHGLSYVSQLRCPLTEAQMDLFFLRADADGTGTVTKPELFRVFFDLLEAEGNRDVRDVL